MKGTPKDRIMTAPEALARVKSGQRVFIGSGAAEPAVLAEAFAARGRELADAEAVHLMTLGRAPYAAKGLKGNIRHNALFIGANVREAVREGFADYTPCFLSEVPGLMRSGKLPIDAALITVSPPKNGFCSLGVSVDVVKAAVETAGFVAAQVNESMPRTSGNSLIRLDEIDAFVLGTAPLPELPERKPIPESIWIGRYAAALVKDGSTIQAGIGSVPDMILKSLAGKKDLGVHSEMISDGILGLRRSGALSGRRKTLHPGKIVASFCMGSRALYEAVDRNPAFEFHPSDYVNDPAVIARNDSMVSINSALQIDLTGQIAADSIGRRFYSGVGGQVDFVRGAARSRNGRSIIALPSTALGGGVSRIVTDLSEGTGVVTTRADVDFVVTEYGIASLKGRTIRERAVALISIAHPDHRPGLAASAAKAGYLDSGHVLPLSAGRYRVELESSARFGETEVFFRPLKPSDERRLKELFYSQSMETTHRRFGSVLKRLSAEQFQRLVAIDFVNTTAIAAFVRRGGRERMIAVARYGAAPEDRFAEAAFTVHDDWQGKGIGTFMARILSKVAEAEGLEGFRAEIAGLNVRMRRVFASVFRRAKEEDIGEDGVRITVLFKDLNEARRPKASSREGR